MYVNAVKMTGMRTEPRTAAASSKRVQQGEATRAALIEAAQRLFTQEGYTATATADIVAAAQVTRGALYHHFRDKEDLFRAVLEATEAETVHRVAEAAQGGTPLAQLHAAIDAFFESCLDPVVQRIMLEDGPAVLGWEAWHDIDARYAYGVIAAGLEAAIASGELDAQPVEYLAHLMVGAFMQAGMVVARAADQAAATAAMAEATHRLLEGLRPAGTRQPPGT